MKSSDKLTVYLAKIIQSAFLESLIPEIVDSFKPLSLKKNEFLVQENKVCNYFCFLEEGILQHAIYVDGNEKTTYLALKNSCTAALQSFLHDIPSRKNIKALSNCKLWVIKSNDFKRLLKKNKAFHQFYFNLIENQIFLIDNYRIDLLTLTPEERYKKMLQNEPNLLQEVPLHYLSSFLGISNRHMSRIRKQVK